MKIRVLHPTDFFLHARSLGSPVVAGGGRIEENGEDEEDEKKNPCQRLARKHEEILWTGREFPEEEANRIEVQNQWSCGSRTNYS